MNRYSNLNFSIICKLRQQNYFPHIKYISKDTFSVSSSSVDEEGSDEASLVLIAGGNENWHSLSGDQMSSLYWSFADADILKSIEPLGIYAKWIIKVLAKILLYNDNHYGIIYSKKNWKQSQNPIMREWLHKFWFIQTGGLWGRHEKSLFLRLLYKHKIK